MNMKKLILITVLVTLIAVPAFGKATLDGVSPHLGWWDPDYPRATHQYWDFTEFVYTDGYPYLYYQDPATEQDNPFFSKAWLIGVYDPVNDWFTGDPCTGNIVVLLEIGNYPEPLAEKEIWIDIGFTGELINTSASGTGPESPYRVGVLPPFGDPCGVAELGYDIYPNPDKEDIFFTITPGATAGAKLEWIHVDTVCIPEPGAILLGGIGVCLVGWLRRRGTL